MTQRRLTLATIAVLALIAGGFLAYRQFFAPAATVSAPASGYAGQPTLGRANAPVKLILFENFLCEHCKAFEEGVFPRIQRDYIDTGQVQAYYVNLAWGSENATSAGLAGECSYRQDELAFWEYKRVLYAAQTDEAGDWASTDNLVAIARSVPALDAAELRACLADGRYLSEVQRDLELGDRVGVRGTPSIVVDTQGFEAPSYETLAGAIERALGER